MWSLSCCAKMGGDCEEVMEKVNSEVTPNFRTAT